jgi:hypothetical protein
VAISAAVGLMASMEEIRRQIKEEETGTLACNGCREAVGTFKCGRCGAPYCSKACQRSHYPAHRAYCERNAETVSDCDGKDVVKKSSRVMVKSQKWFIKHRVQFALLARALIPPEAYFSQVLILEVNECIDCHRGTCTCVESSGLPLGGFHICAASIEVRPIQDKGLSDAIENVIKNGFNFNARGRMVALIDNSQNFSVISTQWCYTDSLRDAYTATQLLQVINRDEKYAVPDFNRQCMVILTLILLILAIK